MDSPSNEYNDSIINCDEMDIFACIDFDNSNTTGDQISLNDDLSTHIRLVEAPDDICLMDCDARSSDSIEKIEETVLSFLTQVFEYTQPTGLLKDTGLSDAEERSSCQRPKGNKIRISLADRRKHGVDEISALKHITYPKKSASGSAKPFAQLFRVLDFAYESILTQAPITKRDIYYKDIGLFRSQRVVDSIVDDIAATFKLERSDLNIRASSKGLIIGAGLTIYLRSGEEIRTNDTEGMLIPVGEDISSFGVNEDIEWILVVEKEAVFQTLCRMTLPSHFLMPGRGLIITGKGYPDIATRHMVATLAESFPKSVPLLALVDGDPYGLDILSVYKYGSLALQHENTKLAAPRIKWLGLWLHELESFDIDKDKLLQLTKRDEKKALSMIRRPTSIFPKKWKKELVHMLHNRKKAEIEILTTSGVLHISDDTKSSVSQESFEHCSDLNIADCGFNTDDSSRNSTFLGAPSNSSQSAHCSSVSSSILSSSAASRRSENPLIQTPLLQYLSVKITNSVNLAVSRTNGTAT